MVYVPINVQAYTSAYAGAVSGMAVNGWISSPTGANYTLVCAVAGAFAEAFDVAWNNAAQLNTLESSAIQSVCAQEFSNRGPGPLASAQFQDPANWAIPAKACATLALQCDLYFAGQGITPPTPGGGAAPNLSSFTFDYGVAADIPPGNEQDYPASGILDVSWSGKIVNATALTQVQYRQEPSVLPILLAQVGFRVEVTNDGGGSWNNTGLVYRILTEFPGNNVATFLPQIQLIQTGPIAIPVFAAGDGFFRIVIINGPGSDMAIQPHADFLNGSIPRITIQDSTFVPPG
jgi:hypothetical protein